jgi:hypothetical protein
MIRNLIAASIGRRIAGRNNGGQGALIGAMLPFVARRGLGPLGLVLGAGYVAKKIYDGRKTPARGNTYRDAGYRD